MVDDRTVVRVVGSKQGAPRGGKVRAPWEAEPPEAMKWGNAHGAKGGREMNRDRNMREKESVGVAETPKQAEKAQWTWVDPVVWTSRMVTALVTGVKGGTWFSLIDKVYARKTLESAFRDVKRNNGAAGVDNITVRKFEEQLDQELTKLAEEIQTGTYQPQAVRRKYIAKPGSKEGRPLGIPTVRSRTVQAALKHVIEPIFEKEFAECSHGFRPERGCKDALRVVEKLLQEGYLHVVDADITRYFDMLSKHILMGEIRKRIADTKVLALIESFLNQGVVEEMREWIPERGTPQGGVLSPLLANIYLNPLDHHIEQAGHKMVRYADDFVVMCRTAEEANTVMKLLEQWMQDAELTLHPDKTRIVDMSQPQAGFDFLGYHFERTRRKHELKKWPRPKSMQKFKDAIRELTHRCNGKSLEEIILRINARARGWYQYFKHSYANTFDSLDGWVRMRLRSILRKRRKGKGRGRGADHQRWPNSFFVEHELFSFSTAHDIDCHPARR